MAKYHLKELRLSLRDKIEMNRTVNDLVWLWGWILMSRNWRWSMRAPGIKLWPTRSGSRTWTWIWVFCCIDWFTPEHSAQNRVKLLYGKRMTSAKSIDALNSKTFGYSNSTERHQIQEMQTQLTQLQQQQNKRKLELIMQLSQIFPIKQVLLTRRPCMIYENTLDCWKSFRSSNSHHFSAKLSVFRFYWYFATPNTFISGWVALRGVS